MRKFAFVLAPLALAACSNEPAEVAEVEDTAEMEAPAEEMMVTGNGSAPGTYEVTNADGSTGMSMLNADGTYVNMDAEGAMLDEGTWAVVDGMTCFTDNSEGAEAECWTETPAGEDGTFTATSASGETVTVSPAPAG